MNSPGFPKQVVKKSLVQQELLRRNVTPEKFDVDIKKDEDMYINKLKLKFL
jgi:hypothetical protein